MVNNYYNVLDSLCNDLECEIKASTEYIASEIGSGIYISLLM